MKILKKVALLSACLVLSSSLLTNAAITNKMTITNQEKHMAHEREITVTDEDGNILKNFDISNLKVATDNKINTFGTFPCCRYSAPVQYYLNEHVRNGEMCSYSIYSFYQCINCGTNSPLTYIGSGLHNPYTQPGQAGCPY